MWYSRTPPCCGPSHDAGIREVRRIEVRTSSQFAGDRDRRAEKSELVHDAAVARRLALSPMPHINKGSTGRRVAVLAAAVAALLAQPPAHALSLGQVELLSYLGEPLRAEIPLGVAPGERVLPGCIRLATDATAGTRAGIPYEARLRLTGSGANQRLLIDGTTPLREPIVDLAVSVNCPGTPVFERGYLLMLTPAVVAAQRRPENTAQLAEPTRATDPAPASSASPAAATSRPVTTPRSTTTRPAASTQRPRQAAGVPLRGGESYRVAPGDTLSTIAQRVTDRPDTLWNQAEAIFTANPTAFIGGDRNRIRAGAVIDIPAAAARSASTNATLSTPARTAAPAQQRDPVVTAAENTAAASTPATAVISQSATSTSAAAVASSAAAQATAARVGPPLPARTNAGPQPGIAEEITVDTAATAATAATANTTVSPQAPAQRGDGLLRWLTGLLVGLGFIILGGLLAWTALRRKPEADDATVDLEETGRATLAPPPSFDPGLMQTGAMDLRKHGMQVEEATDEVEVLKAGAAPGMDLDDLFPAVAPSDDPSAEADRPADKDALEIPVDDPALAGAAAASAPPQINIEGTGSFKVADLALGRRPSGETTVEHRFAGFSDTQALELQMTEAMAMLEQDYTSRFEAAVSLDDTGSLEATDTLHGVPEEVLRSLKDLEAQSEVQPEAESDATLNEAAATAIMPVPEISADSAPDAACDDDDESAPTDDDTRTALLEQPPGKVNTG